MIKFLSKLPFYSLSIFDPPHFAILIHEVVRHYVQKKNGSLSVFVVVCLPVWFLEVGPSLSVCKDGISRSDDRNELTFKTLVLIGM